jgi:uncharacterized membrane protein
MLGACPIQKRLTSLEVINTCVLKVVERERTDGSGEETKKITVFYISAHFADTAARDILGKAMLQTFIRRIKETLNDERTRELSAARIGSDGTPLVQMTTDCSTRRPLRGQGWSPSHKLRWCMKQLCVSISSERVAGQMIYEPAKYFAVSTWLCMSIMVSTILPLLPTPGKDIVDKQSKVEEADRGFNQNHEMRAYYCAWDTVGGRALWSALGSDGRC